MKNQSIHDSLSRESAAVTSCRRLHTPGSTDHNPGESATQPDELPNFDDLVDLDPILKTILKENGLQRMTEIQAKTWDASVGGNDVIGRARTGTGKTLAFLLPSMERLLRNKHSGNQIRALIISPTRELARQIGEQAQMLVHGYKRTHSSQVMYGGASRERDVRDLERRIPSILTATPGRLIDHLNSTQVKSKPFGNYLSDVDVLVLDEMDRLLGMGFCDDIVEILQYLPQNRQTLLFSATSPPEVRRMIDQCVKPNHTVVDCMQEGDPSTYTNTIVGQRHVVLPPDRIVSGVLQIVQLLMMDPDYKILVFFPTTAQVTYYSQLFNRGIGLPVLSIHSKMSQSLRTNNSDRFRFASRAVLFTSDISARGVDYPDVTHVIQVGAASDSETYIHRLGRTGRAGKKGQGLLILTSDEIDFLNRDLRGFAVPRDQKIQALLSGQPPREIEGDLMRIAHEIRAGNAAVIEGSAIMAYLSILGFYQGRLRSFGGQSTDALVRIANGFAAQCGLHELPELTEAQAERFGLKDHTGISIQKRWVSGSKFDVGSPSLTAKVAKSEPSKKDVLWGKARHNIKRVRAPNPFAGLRMLETKDE
jgi:ATP-dependent RNA helicase MSS116